jgi:RIO kinase 1
MANKRRPIDLAEPGFQREFLREFEQRHLMQSFGVEQWSIDSPGVGPDGEDPPARFATSGAGRPCSLVSSVVRMIGDGKEATVYCCRGGPRVDFPLAAAKVYRARSFRAFSDESTYRAGEVIRDQRAARAMRNKSRAGRRMHHGSWVSREWETLCLLRDAGADVPTPYACTSDAILMEYFGDSDDPAPLLLRAKLSEREARRVFRRLLDNVEVLLACDRVHGDLSAYNILWTAEGVRLIDFPQAVDARVNPNARDLLGRDVANLSRHFARYGVSADARAIARDLWSRYARGELDV